MKVSLIIERVIEHIGSPYESWDNFLEALGMGLTIFTSFDSKTGWPYLLSSLFIAGVVFVIWKTKGLIDPGTSFLKFMFPREVYLHPSAIVDYKFIAIDYLIKPLTYLPVTAALTYLTHKYVLALGDLVWPQFLTFSAQASPLFTALIVLLVLDFGAFFAHFLTHKIPFLWCFHQVHHSAEVLTPITVHRWHPVDQIFLAVFVSATTGVGATIYATAFSEPVNMTTVFGLNIIMFIFYVIGFQLRHSHIWLSYGPVLSWVFISPAQHQIHHSIDPKHLDKNFGLVFSIWDALFRSLYIPRTRESLKLGLVNVDPSDFYSPSKLFYLPFVKASKCIRGKGLSIASGRTSVKKQELLP